MEATGIDTCQIATAWLSSLNEASTSGDIEQFSQHFLSDGWLRDVLCFTWDFTSVEGRDKISAFLSEPLEGGRRIDVVGLHDIKLDSDSTLGGPSTVAVPRSDAPGIQGAFRFTLREPHARGRGFFHLLPSSDGYKALALYISLHDLIGHEEPTARPRGIPEDATAMTTWEENREREVEAIERDPTVLIVGGGQCGLMAAARFRRMGVRALVVEKTPRIGDVWRNRYPTLSLHFPAHYSSFLYQPYPQNFPQFIGRTKLADFMESYAIQQELTIWTSSAMLPNPAPIFNPESKRWTVVVDRAGNHVTLNPKHLIVATGRGAPYVPRFPGQEKFKGEVYHSDFHTGGPKYKGKRVVVIGAGNASADICQDFACRGASTTLVQRSATFVQSVETTTELVTRNYKETRDIDDADLVANFLPPRLVVKMGAEGIERSKKPDAELLQGLEEKGFKLTWEYKGQKGGAPIFVYEAFGGGTMLDTGFGQLVIDGHVKVKQGVELSHFEENAVVFNDGSKLDSDVVVLATGYQPWAASIENLMGPTIAAKVGSVWGLDDVGELRCAAGRPTGQQGLWIFPGGLGTARYFSRHIVLQILAEELGIKKSKGNVSSELPSLTQT